MANKFSHKSSKSGSNDLVPFDEQLESTPVSMLTGVSPLDYHPGVDGTFLLELPMSPTQLESFPAPNSSSSLGLAASPRRRQSSSVTAMSFQSLGSDSQSSRGLSGTPEATPSGKATPADGGWPALNPKPSQPNNKTSSFNPIQNSYSLPPRRPRRTTNKPKPEPSKEEREAKKIHNREKNKDAADRARRKKKKYANHLEESKSELENQNSALKMELETLADEAARIRAELLGHSSCHDSKIGQWIHGGSTQYGSTDSTQHNMAITSLSYSTDQFGGPGADLTVYQQVNTQQESPSPPMFGDVVYQQDAGFSHSPVVYGDDHDPAFGSGVQTSMLGDSNFDSDLLSDQYADFHTDFDYIVMPDGSYQ